MHGPVTIHNFDGYTYAVCDRNWRPLSVKTTVHP